MGVKLNGVDLETTYGFDLANIEGLEAPRIRQNIANIPGVHGELDFGGTYETRNIYLVGHISATTHANSLTALQGFLQRTAVLPLQNISAPLDGAPLSPQSVLGTLEIPDITDRYFSVVYNGIFEAEWIAARQISRKIRLRIGFKQTNPWANANVLSGYVSDSTANQNHHQISNDGGISTPPKMAFSVFDDAVSSFSVYNHAIDPFNTVAITGTLGGTPFFVSQFDLGVGSAGPVEGGIKFDNDTDFVTFPLANNFSLHFGTIELVYFPEFVGGGPPHPTSVLWTIYNATDHYWRLWYDSVSTKFKFTMKTPSTETVLTSTVGVTALGVAHYIAVSWDLTSAYLSVNGEIRVSAAKNTITIPSTIRIGSFGNNTLHARGTIDEFIMWNRDVGQSYVQRVFTGSRFRRTFNRPVPGVLLYADFNFSKDAVGAGPKIFTYANVPAPIDIGDFLFVNMEKQTVFFWDSSAATKTNAIANSSNIFFDLQPGTNTLSLPFTPVGIGKLRIMATWQQRFLL